MRPYILCSLLVFSLSITSCLQQKEQPVSKEEALAFAKSLDSSIKNGDDQFFLNAIHNDVFFERVEKASNIDMNLRLKRRLREGLKVDNIGTQIIKATENGQGSYSMVRQYEKDRKQHVVFRLDGGQGLNYHDFELIKFKDKVYMADFFIFMSGENFSRSMGDLVEGLLEAEKAGKTGLDGDKFTLIKRLTSQKKYREAKKVFDGMPEVVKERRLAQIIYLSICSGLGTEEYTKALEQFAKKFEHEPTMQLSLLDVYFLRKDYATCIEAIDRVDSLIGGDPFLDYFRGVIYYNWEKPVESRESLEKLYAKFPDFSKGVIELIHNYLIAHDYEKARSVIAEYRESDNFDKQLLEANLEVYPDFEE